VPGSPFDNPFQVTMPVGADDVIDREEAISQICALAREGNNARVVAPRRYGKTSVVKQAQRELTRSGGWETVYVDLLGITTLDELTARIERAYVEALKGPVARWFDGLRRTLRPTIGVGGGAIPVRGAVDLSARTQSLVERLALPAQVHTKTGSRVHVVFDEFQEIDELDVAVDGVLRSEIQHHAGEARYVFAGSAIRMMELMFTDRKRAFYAQTIAVPVPVVPEGDLADYVHERFDRTGKGVESTAISALLDLVRGHPQRAMVAAHYLWDETSEVAGVEQWDEAYRRLMRDLDDEMRTVWMGLSRADRVTLSNVATGRGPYASAAGGSERSGGAAKASVGNLVGRGLVERSGRRYVVVDPLLERWVWDQRP
jgi:uncharacterized protein